MYKISKLSAVLIAGLLLGGCANSDLKPTDILCPLLGGTLGAGCDDAWSGSRCWFRPFYLQCRRRVKSLKFRVG
mgnify:CR=1 FL=1